MDAMLPPSWKCLTIDQYDGTTNPNEHIGVYVTQISLYTMEYGGWCPMPLVSHIFEGTTLS